MYNAYMDLINIKNALDVPLHLLRYFYYVAKYQHFTKAADALNMTQPPLSRRIQQLEESLGVTLFHRTNREVTLTKAGEYLLEASTRMFQILDKDIDTVIRIHEGKSGIITLAFTGSTMPSLLPLILKKSRECYPDLLVHVRQLTTTQQIKALNNGSIDLGLLVPPVFDPSIETTLIRKEPYIICIPLMHPLAQETHIAISDLKNEPFVMAPESAGKGYYDAVMTLCEMANFRPKVMQTAQEQTTIVSLVAANFGIAIVPEATQYFHHPGVVYRYLTDTVYNKTAIAWNRQHQLSDSRLLADLIVNEFTQLNPGNPTITD